MPEWPVMKDPGNHQQMRDLRAEIERLREALDVMVGEDSVQRRSAIRSKALNPTIYGLRHDA